MKNKSILRATRVRCPDCGEEHPATVERRPGQNGAARVVGRFVCGEAQREVQLSGNAGLYQHILGRSHFGQEAADPAPRRTLLNLVEITDTCNFSCPVCYAGCGPQRSPHFASEAEVLAAVQGARALGARSVTLTGGEPTEHPGLASLVRAVSRLGVRVAIPTNGLRLGREPGLAARLKAAGLHKVSVQLDTFDPAVHRAMRGNEHLPEKLRAVERCQEVGLRLGLVCTVTHLNLGEVADVLEYGLGLTPALFTVAFQVATPSGRHDLPEGPEVDREAVLERLLERAEVPGLGQEHLWPLPRFRPWGLHIHPDCGANLYLLTHGPRRRVLDELLDTGAFFGDLGRSGLGQSFAEKNLVPLAHALRRTPPARWPELLGHLRGFATGRGERGLVIVGVGGFCREDFYDLERVEHCPTTINSPDGPVSPCLRFRG